MENNNKQSNTIAIVGFILSFFIAIAGLICSIIGLKKSKELNNGKGFSIAGIIISSIEILFGLVVTILLIMAYYHGDNIVVEDSKNNNSSEIKEKLDDEIEKNKSNVKEIVINYNNDGSLLKVDLSNCKDSKICNIKYNDINIEIEELESIKINGQELMQLAFLEEVYILDTNIIIITGGTDIRNTEITILDKDGNLIKSINELDDKYPDMAIKDGFEKPMYEISETSIKLEGTRITHGPSIASVMYDETSELSDKERVLSYCETYNRYLNEVIYGTYEIDYLGNNKFSEIKNTGYTLLKDSDIKCSND